MGPRHGWLSLQERKRENAPFSSRIPTSDQKRVANARSLRKQAADLLEKVGQAQPASHPDLTLFKKLVSQAPSTLGESAAAIQDVANVGPKYFQAIGRKNHLPQQSHMRRILTAIIEIADERLKDANQEDYAAGWVPNIYKGSDDVHQIHAQLLRVAAFVKSSNSLAYESEIDEHWRRTLIDALETIVSLLKAPLIERSLLHRAIEGLRQFARLAREIDGENCHDAEAAANSLDHLLDAGTDVIFS